MPRRSDLLPAPLQALLPRAGQAIFAAALALALTACGGGGGGSASGGGSDPTQTTVFSVDPTLSGVAAVGAPLTNARIQVVDGKGVAVGSTTSSTADGSYKLTLSSKNLNSPLLLQVRGLDAAGVPQVLHSAVPILSASTPAMVVNITPLSNAIVALSLGSDPQAVFAAPTQNATAVIAVASAASGAGEFVKSLVKTQLTDLKFSNVAALDLLADPSFSANKSAQDLLLESLRVNVLKSSKGVMQLQLSNKLQAGSSAEVVVELATAQTELLKTTASTPANAIVSTLKATSSPTATLANLAPLDDLSAALNKLIAQGANATTIAASPLLASYDQHNGQLKAAVVAKLADFASKNRQFGRWLLTGCADDVVTGGLCKRVLVSAPISDSTGTVVELFSDAISYNKTSTSGSVWNLIGNGKKLELASYPLAYLALAADGTLSTSSSPNPAAGIQLLIQAQDSSGAKLMDTATVQTPGGFSIPFGYCAQPQLCISSTPGASNLIASGGVADTVLQQSSVGWIGGADTVRNAKFIATYTLAGGAEARAIYLPVDVPAELPQARFPTLDGVSATATLRGGQFLVGTAVSWATWAAANPDMRLISIRTVLSIAEDASQAPLIKDSTPPLPPATGLTLAGISVPDAYVPTRYELWLGAQDSAGRRYFTRYTLQP